MKLSPTEIFKGKKIFFIGGTGFVGKVTLSMLLHNFPDIGKVYATVRARDGRELFYIDPDRKLMSVEVKTGATFEVGVPKPLFDTGVTSYIANKRYAVFPDGQRFLINVPVEAQTSAPITVVLNWMADLK